APTLGILIVAYGYLGLRALDAHFAWPPGSQPAGMDHVLKEVRLREAVRGGILITQQKLQPLDAHAARFLGSLQVAGWVARLYVLVLLLRPVVLRDRLEAPPEDAERIRRTQSRRPLSAFGLRPDKHHLLVADGRGLVAYAVRNAVAVACGGPLCAPEDVEASVRDFVAHCHKHGWSPCFYAVPEEDLPGHAAARLKSLRIGEEGLLDPGAVAAPAAAAGGGPPDATALEVWRYDRAAAVDAVLDEQIVEVSDDWLAEREIGELHFTFGSLDLEELGSLPVFVCGQPGGRIEAFCTWLPYADGAGLTLNLLRRRRDARAGAGEVLLTRALAQIAAAGVREASLGLVPLAAEARADAGPFGLADRLGAIYRYDDLFALKDALAPRWEPRHLVYEGDADLPRVAVAVVDVHTTLHERSPIPRLIAAARALRHRAARERS
ncbi:MAG TPA: DUF2156 domain-containing protein, partial [Vicinamibacteria bacterium]|nr:DUF2156 domain-containing protein [Vicinamibacteria bacterium]